MNKYLPIIQKINTSLEEFNLFLRPQYAISLFDERKLHDNKDFINITGGIKYKELETQPNWLNGGIYFYMGVAESDNAKIYIYIGKASLTSTIGKRLYGHFSKPMDEEKVIKNHNGENQIIELICSIPLENTFMAPALEEFLITKLGNENCILMNTVGNLQ